MTTLFAMSKTSAAHGSLEARAPSSIVSARSQSRHSTRPYTRRYPYEDFGRSDSGRVCASHCLAAEPKMAWLMEITCA